MRTTRCRRQHATRVGSTGATPLAPAGPCQGAPRRQCTCGTAPRHLCSRRSAAAARQVAAVTTPTTRRGVDNRAVGAFAHARAAHAQRRTPRAKQASAISIQDHGGGAAALRQFGSLNGRDAATNVEGSAPTPAMAPALVATQSSTTTCSTANHGVWAQYPVRVHRHRLDAYAMQCCCCRGAARRPAGRQSRHEDASGGTAYPRGGGASTS